MLCTCLHWSLDIFIYRFVVRCLMYLYLICMCLSANWFVFAACICLGHVCAYGCYMRFGHNPVYFTAASRLATSIA